MTGTSIPLRGIAWCALVCSACGWAYGAEPAAGHVATDLAREVLSASVDATACYHVRELRIQQEDVTFYLTEGYLVFGKPVNGAPISAVFTSDVEGGDAEVVLLPPDRAERRTLASFTGSPNLNEHFTQAIFFFTDRSARQLARQLANDPNTEKAPEKGAEMAQRWDGTVGTLLANFESRIVLDLMTKGPSGEGFFEATLRGRKLGEFDVVHDARASEQVGAGKVTVSDGTAHWETWTRFVATPRRNRPAPAPEEQILSYRIDASMNAALSMHCVTRIHVRATADSGDVMPFEMDAAMRVVSAKVDGVTAEVYQHDSLRTGLIQNSGNELLIVVPPQPLRPGTEHEIEIVHEGKVVEDTGNGIYTVSARGTWYPSRGAQFATYDVVYRYPQNLDLVSAGAVRDEHVDGGMRVTHRVPEGRMRLLGFNLGRYTTRDSVRDGITLEVAANGDFEEWLRPKALPPLVLRGAGPVTHSITVPQIMEAPATETAPTDRMDAIAAEVRSAITFFRARFGEPPLRHIEVSPVTGRFGQGFAGMIYLPTVMYLNPEYVQKRAASRVDEAFMDELLPAHETAHQWWGNIVTTDSYHHEWLMESLANYSALMFLESTKGPRAIETALNLYRDEMLTKGPDGATAESRGPVVEGRRLESAAAPGAADAVLYGKGTWIIHMLRRRLGDAAFLRMLAALRQRYEFRTITTEDFRVLCAQFLPAGSTDPKLVDFFGQWVYDTGVPSLKLTYTVSGNRISVTITQTDAPKDFTVEIPLEIHAGALKPVVKTIRTANGAVNFTLDAGAPGAKAILDPTWSVLRR